MTATGELDKQAIKKMYEITQAVMDGKLSNAKAAEQLRQLRKRLNEVRFGLKKVA